MKLATFSTHGRTHVGVVVDDYIVDLSVAAPELPKEMAAFLGAGEAAMEAARRAAGSAVSRVPLLEALNYAEHIAETGRDTPSFPRFFNHRPSPTIPPSTDPSLR